MNKYFGTLVAVALLLAACDVNIDSVEKKSENTDSEEIGFSVYVNRGVKTKAGMTGELTTATLKDLSAGFGVFAYYGNGALYNETMLPDFMYDQKVISKTYGTQEVWVYSPIKYWPNEFGESASSEDADRLTFFAYAPFADVKPSTGVVTATGAEAESGIIGMSRNIAKGDPVVMYSSNLTPGAGVDLCWGVAAEDFKSSIDGENNDVKKGYPFINVVKTKTGDRLNFEFNHALAQFNVQIDADINDDVSSDDSTKIYVRSVTFNGFSMRGSLNLNSNTQDGPIWYDISGTGRLKREPITVFDGRTDEMEGVSTAIDPSERPHSLNPLIVQSFPYGTSNQTPGVTTTAVNLFNSPEVAAPVMVIPTPGVPVSVTIVYDVETQDHRLAGFLSDGKTHGSSVENKITKSINLTDGTNMILASGKKYVLNLHLGLTSVKFDAVVAGWDDTHYGSAYLPQNTTSIGSVSLTDSSGPYSDVTVWKNETISTVPTVKVLDGDGNEIPRNKVDLSWASSNEAVATVDEHGAVTIVGAAGVAVITCTASQGEGNSKTASYKVNVNEVTAITVTPETASVTPNETTTLTATLTHTGNGTVVSWPTVSWSSDPAKDYVSVSPDDNSWTIVDGTTLTTTATITGVAVGSEDITALIREPYAASTLSDNSTVACAQIGFRGYELSRGVVKRNGKGSYELTPGTDPFELYTIGASNDRDSYYFKFSLLSEPAELGKMTSNYKFLIIPDSPNLPGEPGEWSFPSFSDWTTIITGEPQKTIKVGGATVTSNAFALIKCNGKKGMLLLRDGCEIESGYLTSVGTTTLNSLTEEQLNYLLGKGCIVLSYSGFESNGTWYGPDVDARGAVIYYCTGSATLVLDLNEYHILNEGTLSTKTTTSVKAPIRLVKKLAD